MIFSLSLSGFVIFHNDVTCIDLFVSSELSMDSFNLEMHVLWGNSVIPLIVFSRFLLLLLLRTSGFQIFSWINSLKLYFFSLIFIFFLFYKFIFVTSF